MSNKTLSIALAVLFIIAAALLYTILRDNPAENRDDASNTDTSTTTEPAITEKDDLIRLESPISGADITSPLTISGEARGTWFFEASFPIVLTDWDGRIIAESYATAEGEWMTEEYVDFTGTIEFDVPEEPYDRGFLILQKANPSGLPEHDNALEIPIRFE